MSRSPTPTPFAAGVLPILEGGDGPHLQQALDRIKVAISTTQRMTPQPATRAPTVALDGMVRLARDPWRPVSGQTTDQWVYYDGAGSVWRLLGTAPTNT